jgi:mannose-6-phosphate isomerase-like protein (cupin superfamily)
MKAEIRFSRDSTEFPIAEGCFIQEVANDTGDPNVSISRARVPPGGATEWHHLQGIEERYVIVSGRGLVEVGGVAATEVTAGDVVRIPAGTPQRITNAGAEDLVFWCVCSPRFMQNTYISGR